MKLQRLGLFLIALLISGSFLKGAVTLNDAFVRANDLDLGSQSLWGAYSGGDSPEGGFRAVAGAGVGTVDAAVTLPITLPAGTYNVFAKVRTYNNVTAGAEGEDIRWTIRASLGTANSPIVNGDDRDLANLQWQGPMRVVSTSPTNIVRFLFDKVPADSISQSLTFRALFISPNTNLFILATDEVQDLYYPVSADYDNTPAIVKNVVPNGSFETGTWPFGAWRSEGRDSATYDMWDGTVGHSGNASMKITQKSFTGFATRLISLPLRFSANKTNSLSVWVKTASGTATVSIYLQNTGTVPPGYPAAQSLSASRTATTAWSKLEIPAVRLLAYPDDQAYVILELAYNATTGTVAYFDDVVLTEGASTPSNFSPRWPVEFGLFTTKPGHIYHTNEVLDASLRLYNTTGVSTNVQLWWDVYDHNNSIVTNRTFSTTVLANQVATLSLDVGGRLGAFRGVLYGTNHYGEQEFCWGVVPPPLVSGNDEAGMFGGHANTTDWQLPVMERLGMKFIRWLSPAAHTRWSEVEPTQGGWVWNDTAAQTSTNFHQIIVGNIGEAAPTFAKRAFFTLSGVSGTFQKGEVIRSGGFTGTVATVLLSGTHATGNALQIANNSPGHAAFTYGTPPAQGMIVTGLTSTATATIAMLPWTTGAAPVGTMDWSYDLEFWQNFVTNVVTHYKNRIHWWEISNEPNQDAEVPKATSQKDDYGFYAEMLRRAVIAVTNIDSTAKIVAFGGVLTSDYVTNVLSKLPTGFTNWITASSLHFYPPNGNTMASLRSDVKTFHSGMQLWNDESGVWDLSYMSGQGANQVLNIEFLQPWQNLMRYYRSQRQFPEMLMYNMFQSLGYGGPGSKYFYYDARSFAAANTQVTHPTLIDWDDTIKPKGIFFAIAARILDHGYGMGKILNASANMEGYIFTNNAIGIATIWSPSFTLHNINVTGQLTKDQYAVKDMMYNSVTTNGLLIPITRSPVYIVGSSGVTALFLSNALATASVSSAVADTNAPILSVPLLPDGPVPLGTRAYVRSLALDNKDIPDDLTPTNVLYSWKLSPLQASFQAWSGNSLVFYDDLTNGIYTFNVQAKDSAGNTSAVQQRSIVVQDASGGIPEEPPGDPPVGSTNIVYYTNSATIFIDGFQQAAVYPSTQLVSQISGSITNITVNFPNISHEFPGDLMMMLVAPNGTHVLMMSDAGGGTDMVNFNLTFSMLSTIAIPQAGPVTNNGVYMATDYAGADTFAAPAPAAPHSTSLTAFTNASPNGTWSLYVYDKFTGDAGGITNGWILGIETDQFSAPNVAPVLAAIGNKVARPNVLLSFQASATDSDTPAQTLTYSLFSAQSGMTISPSGLFNWTPTTAQAGTNTVGIRVTDSGTTPMSDTESISIFVQTNLFVVATGSLTNLRTGTINGTGTVADPYWGDFDAILNSRVTGETLNFSAGAYYTSGWQAGGPVIKRGVRLQGSGTNAAAGTDTTIYASLAATQTSAMAVISSDVADSWQTNINIEIRDMILDAASTNASSSTYVDKRNAAIVYGYNNVISNVVARNVFGRYDTQKECFAIALMAGGGVIDRCIVGDVDGDYCTAYLSSGVVADGSGSYGYVQNSRAIFPNEADHLQGGLFGVNFGNATNLIIRNNIIENGKIGIYFDTGTSSNVTAHGNVLSNQVDGLFVNLTTHPTILGELRGIDKLSFVTNTIYPTTNAPYTQAMFLYHGATDFTSCVNQNYAVRVTLIGNTITYGSDAARPSWAQGLKQAASIKSDAIFGESSSYPGHPVGISNIVIINNIVQSQQDTANSFVYTNFPSLCVGGGAVNVTFNPTYQIPTPPPIPPTGGGGGGTTPTDPGTNRVSLPIQIGLLP